jgi:hypothetical protein
MLFSVRALRQDLLQRMPSEGLPKMPFLDAHLPNRVNRATFQSWGCIGRVRFRQNPLHGVIASTFAA